MFASLALCAVLTQTADAGVELVPAPSVSVEAPVATVVAAPAAPVVKVSIDELVLLAIRDSGTSMEAKGKVTEWEGKLAEVQSVFYPKLVGLGFVAPLYRLNGTPFTEVQRDFSSWGPYFRLQAILAQPIYTFGRASHGKAAAQGRLDVEKARMRQTLNTVAFELRKLYLIHLYARSFLPSLQLANRILSEAEEKAKELYAEGDGSVTKVDLSKLRYAATELSKYRIQAEIGVDLSLAAIKHMVGLPQNAVLVLQEQTLPAAATVPALPTLAELIQKASELRPEVEQLKYGEQAALNLVQAEKLASAPVVFAAAQVEVNYSPMWPDINNPFFFDRFNDITPGIAVGLQFDVDLAKSFAKAKSAEGLVEQVEGLKKFAGTGIPMEVRKAHDDFVQARELFKLAEEGSEAAKKWMIFAGTAYVAGTGEAKDLLEGLGAYMMGKKGYYDALKALHEANAYVTYATGRTGLAEYDKRSVP